MIGHDELTVDGLPDAWEACNAAVPDAAAAIQLAYDAKLIAGFVDETEPEAGIAHVVRLELGPMAPTEWPSHDCGVVFPISKIERWGRDYGASESGAVVALLRVQLDTGETEIDLIEEGLDPRSPGPCGASGAWTETDQQPVFDMVIDATPTLDLSKLDSYQEWLDRNQEFTAMLDITLRGFVVDVLVNRPDILDHVRGCSAAWYLDNTSSG